MSSSCTRGRVFVSSARWSDCVDGDLDDDPAVGVTPNSPPAFRAGDLTTLDIEPLHRRLQIEEPYRLKLSCIRQRLATRASASPRVPPARPGHDYTGALNCSPTSLIRDSLLANRGELVAGGALDRFIHRNRRRIRSQVATMDVREHSGAHHQALAQPTTSQRHTR